MNEEDIEKVEKLIKKCDECKLHECINCEINWSEIASVRRLIDSYKQLEEENKTLKNVVSEIFNSEDVTDNYIPKSKIKEKIEELKREREYIWEYGSNDELNKINGKIDILEELLE